MAPHQPYLFWAFSQVSYNRWTPLWGCFSTTLEKPSGHFSLLSSKCTPSQFFGRHRKHLQTNHYWLSNVLDIGITPDSGRMAATQRTDTSGPLLLMVPPWT